jgi:hypothetical protein
MRHEPARPARAPDGWEPTAELIAALADLLLDAADQSASAEVGPRPGGVEKGRPPDRRVKEGAAACREPSPAIVAEPEKIRKRQSDTT